MFKFGKNLQIILLLFIILIAMEGGLTTLRALDNLSFGTGYQGARAQFAGAVYEGQQYTASQTHGASLARFDTTLKFDPDEPRENKPNIIGEMTSVFIPEESLSNFVNWIPSDWLTSASYIENPTGEYEWEISNKSYRMEQWTLRWYFSLSAEWDEQYWIGSLTDEWLNQRYQNTEIWFELDLTPIWYFEGAETAYFAIAKCQLAENVIESAKDNSGKVVEPRLDLSVTPQSHGSILPIYYGLFAKSNPASKTPSSYQGVKLNPDLFTDKVYTYVTLNNFGTKYWQILGGQEYKGDVVTFAVDVHIFVIGQWDVKDIQEGGQFEDYGRTAKLGGGSWIAQLFNMPEFRLFGVLVVGFIIFLLLAIFAPSLLVLIFALFGGKKRR